MVPLDEVNIRGTAVAPFGPFVRKRLGDDTWDAMLRDMRPEFAEHFRAGPLAMSWYPFAMASDLLPELVQHAGGDESILRELAHDSLDYSTRHIFKAIFKVGSPGFMVARSDMIWRRYYSSGTMTADVQAGAARVEVRDFPALPPHYDKIVLHSIEAVIAKAGGSLSMARQVRSSDADVCAAFEYRWG